MRSPTRIPIYPRLLTVGLMLCVVMTSDSVLRPRAASAQAARDQQIAALFAPVFYQALGENPRGDYPTNFNFDGDWRGDNNWSHAGDPRFPLKGYIYYAVSETTTHVFIHYAVFHPRDYKGGEKKGAILSELIREGAKHGGKYDPTGLAEETSLAHENDMEGCLVVVAKSGANTAQFRVAYVETLHHNTFSRYLPDEATESGPPGVRLEGRRVMLYIEPKGHGIEAFDGSDKQTQNKDFLVYKFTGTAEDPARLASRICRDLGQRSCSESIGYQLLPLQNLWTRAKSGANQTYGELYDYGQITISVAQRRGATQRTIKIGRIGDAFLGGVGGRNMARPPWGWFGRDNREQSLGLWFFDAATVIKRDFGLGEEFSTAYVRLPFWAAGR
jgi:hypothetical protein